jgi:hypothetical protein
MRSEIDTDPIVLGALACRPGARELAAEVARLLHRYAVEVVARFGLCPHLRDFASGIGALCIVLDRELDAAVAARAVRATGRRVAHAVFPLARVDATQFERFGNAVADWLVADGGPRLVHATFHPDMVGGTEYPARLVGILRRSPDPFVQFIPAGIQQTGTTIAGGPPAHPEQLELTYRRLRGELLDHLVARQAELHAERRRIHARFPELCEPA